MIWQKRQGGILDSLPGLHETIPLGRIRAGLHCPWTCAGEGARGTTHADVARPATETCAQPAAGDGRTTCASFIDANLQHSTTG